MIWKQDWDQTRENHRKFWKGEGTVIVPCSKALRSRKKPREDVGEWPADPDDLMKFWTDEDFICRRARHNMAWSAFPGDALPVVQWSVGPGVLALFLGSEAGLAKNTVWYHPVIQDPEKYGAIRFDPDNQWFQIHESMLRRLVRESKGNYYVGFPDIIENIDILASLRDAQALLVDMIERPEWVKQKLVEINQAYFDVYERFYDIIKFPDGSSVFSFFEVWSDGKVAKVQCDASAMFSPDMFAEFVVPTLTAQCAWLDHSMYHLDGTQCICHLDHLLAIEPLDAIEWTPQAGKPCGSDPVWFDLYRRIRKGGKALQIINGKLAQVEPLFDAIGSRGVYLDVVDMQDEKDLETVYKLVEKYR